MEEKGDGRERRLFSLPFSVGFCMCVFLIFLSLIFPVSALLNGTETLITTDTYKTFNYPPVINGDRIAWSTQDINDAPASGMGSRYIMITDLTSGDQYTIPSPSATWNSAPSIDGDVLVWMQDPLDMVNYSLIAYDLVTNTQLYSIPVTPGDYYSDTRNNVFPKKSGTTIIWQDFSNGNWDIFLYNLTWATGTPPEQIITGGEDQKNPAIYGNYIVYENWSGFNSTIYLYNVSNHTSVRISPSTAEKSPAIDRMNIIWQNLSPTNNKRVILYNITTGETRQIPPTVLLSDQTKPKISGNYIVWEDTRDRKPYTDIYLYDLTDGSERLLTPASSGGKSMPAVYGNRVVWEDTRNEDIYLLTLGFPETCPTADFSTDYLVDPPGGLVTFTDISIPGTAPITYRIWNFSDGSAWQNDPASVTTHIHTFSQDGIYTVKMTAGNAKCRNISTSDPGHTIFVNSPPIADFTATPPEGLSPLTVTFSDISSGAPTNLSWDFGDGGPISAGSPVTHTFTEIGKEYSVTLTAINRHGSSTATKNIRTLMGAHSLATTPVNGISIDKQSGRQFLIYNIVLLPDLSLSGSSLVSYPPSTYGWQNITFDSADNMGFTTDPANSTLYGNVSRFYLMSNDTIATTIGTIPRIGNNWGVSYQINTTDYPLNASFQTDTREGASAKDRAAFDDIAARVWPSGTLVRDVGYTATFAKQNISNEGISVINMSIAENWVKGPYSSVTEGRNYTYIMAYGYDSEGNKRGAILSKRYIFTQDGLDYYETEVPESASYFSTFALVRLSGSGNPFQLVTLSVVSYISPGGDSSGTYIPPDVQQSPEPEVKPTALPDTGKTAKIYSNIKGVITQATTLQSLDGLATLFVGEGIVAKDSTGAALSSVTINSIPAGSVSGISNSSMFTNTGMAYELLPDGSSFSPSVFLNFSVPQAPWGQTYVVRTFDHVTGVWQEVPTVYNPETGIVTAQLSHFCFVALFTRTETPEPSAAAMSVLTPTIAIAPPPPTAMSTFYGMIIWIADLVAKNAVIVAGLVILAVALLFYGRKRRRDRIMH